MALFLKVVISVILKGHVKGKVQKKVGRATRREVPKVVYTKGLKAAATGRFQNIAKLHLVLSNKVHDMSSTRLTH